MREPTIHFYGRDRFTVNVVYNNAKGADSKVAWEYVRNHGYVYNMEGNMEAEAILWENPTLQKSLWPI